MRSGDGFLRCSDGHIRWGIFGAAGVAFVHIDPTGEARVMLQQRSQWAHEGGTWSCPGGAIDEHETPLQAALREASEEVGAIPDEHQLIGEYRFTPATDWTYTTAVVVVADTFGHAANFESVAVDWVPVGEVEQRPLHAGFAAAWPHLRAIIETHPA
ncbi:MAG TPA: NUDIX hydrolase [Ilumatobacteraceae bacterium]|nr:NUDIX hydrolase [Ilumatobacteraceae bacterium]